jgi:LysR family glycine cleavage system transcriptional activator
MRLPPLNQLRVFEAAGRLGSFLAAAQEFNVSPGAVSRHIKGLESHLGFDLFVRVHKGVELTPLGREYQKGLFEAFRAIERTTAAAIAEHKKSPLRIWCSALFMREWLAPRLADYSLLEPEQELSITTGSSDQSRQDGYDLIIRLGRGEDDNVARHFLIETTLTPICSPRYIDTHAKLTEPADILNHTLLFSAVRPHDWTLWLSQHGLDLQQVPRRITMDGRCVVSQAAKESLGVALGCQELMNCNLQSGGVITPLSQYTVPMGAFYLLYPKAGRTPKHVLTFRDWLMSGPLFSGTRPGLTERRWKWPSVAAQRRVAVHQPVMPDEAGKL